MASPAIGVRKRFLSSKASLDFSHPLANGMLFCGVPSLNTDFARQRRMWGTFTQSVSGQTPYERSKFGPGPAMYLPYFESLDFAFGSGAFSVAAAGTTRAGTSGAFFGRGYSYFYGGGWALARESDSKWNFKIMNVAQDSLQDCKASTTSVAGDNVVIGTSNGVNARSLYLDGVLMNTVSTLVNTTTPTYTGSGLFVGNGYSFNGWNVYYPTTIACAWNRELNEQDVRMFTDDPFCMLRS